MFVGVTTDASNPTNWSLYASASGNPSATAHFTYDNTTYTPIQLTGSGTGTRLGYTTNGGTNVNNATVTFDVNYQVAIGTETVPPTGEQETITYTWIAN